MAKKNYLTNTRDRFSFRPVGVLRALDTMQFSDKNENLYYDMCLNYDYLVIGLVGKYVGNLHSNATHI